MAGENKADCDPCKKRKPKFKEGPWLAWDNKFKRVIVISPVLLVAFIGSYLLLSSKAATVLRADFNNDKIVNILDLSIIAANYGKTNADKLTGDADGNFIVNVTDLSILSSEWGQTITPTPSSTPIPTPTPTPTPTPSTVNPITFAIFGEVNNSISDTPDSIFTNVINSMKSSVNTYAISTGDAINDTTVNFINRWQLYIDKENTLGLPVYRVAGDNDRIDLSGGLDAWNTFVKTPTYYSKNIGDIHFIFLTNTYAGHMGWLGYISETNSSNSAEANWLVSDLKAQTHPSTIIVVQHYPMMSGKTNKPYASTQQAEATALEALFVKYGVDIVIAGDTHVYRSTVVNGLPNIQGLPAASTPRQIGTSPIPSCQSGEVCEGGYNGYLTLTLNPNRSLTVSRYKVTTTSVTRMGNITFTDR